MVKWGLKYFLFISFLFLCHWCTAQKQASIWYFAYYAGLDFRNGAPVPLTNSAMWAEASATISDDDGNLLFYTDGVTVWNRNNEPMPNGHNLWGYQSTSQTLIIPQPNNDSICYIFTVSPKYDPLGASGDSLGFYYSIVNMNKANGLGDIVEKNILLFKNSTEKMTAVHHANGKDVWLVAHEWRNNSFRSYLITENGIDTANIVFSQVGVTHTGGDPNTDDNANRKSQMKLSPDGKHLALAILRLGVQVFDFDSNTGVVSNPTPLLQEEGAPCSNGTYGYLGVEFSPNGNLLYYDVDVGCSTPMRLKQYNVQKKSPPVNVSINDTAGWLLVYMQLGLDGKIYISTAGDYYVAAIQRPNDENNPDFMHTAVHLILPTNTTGGLPNFIQSYFLFPDPVVEMPNVFTPNGDLFNERFVPMHFENIGSASLTIVNRWGEQVFQTDSPQEGWDGGVFSDGIYYWFISYYGKNGKQGSQRGWVQLIR